VNKSLYVYDSVDNLSSSAAAHIIQYANEVINSKGVFRIALAGGSTPKRLYTILSTEKYKTMTDWSAWIIYFSDERMVPLDDDLSNYAMAKVALLDRVTLKKGNVHIPAVRLNDAPRVALEYEEQIHRSFGKDNTSFPCMDLVLLGLGTDGHTASLFPDKPALLESRRLVVDSSPGVLPPLVNRITFTLPFINASHRVMFLVTGQDKTQAFDAAYHGSLQYFDDIIPAHKIQPKNGILEWYVTNEVGRED
jgi:6-phosphogluconolactonase